MACSSSSPIRPIYRTVLESVSSKGINKVLLHFSIFALWLRWVLSNMRLNNWIASIMVLLWDFTLCRTNASFFGSLNISFCAVSIHSSSLCPLHVCSKLQNLLKIFTVDFGDAFLCQLNYETTHSHLNAWTFGPSDLAPAKSAFVNSSWKENDTKKTQQQFYLLWNVMGIASPWLQ